MENCGQGIRVSLINEGEKNRFDAVLLRDNIILDSGNGMNNACLEEPVAIDLGVDFVQYAGSIEVCDNVLIGSTLAIVKAPHPAAVYGKDQLIRNVPTVVHPALLCGLHCCFYCSTIIKIFSESACAAAPARGAAAGWLRLLFAPVLWYDKTQRRCLP